MVTLKNIVITDDDEDDRYFFIEALNSLQTDCEITTQSNGVELLNYLKTSLVKPDIIFLDLNMPMKNGYDTLVEIRNTPFLKSVHVVIFSTSTAEGDIERSKLAGANSYISKPNCFVKLKDTISQYLDFFRQEQLSAFTSL